MIIDEETEAKIDNLPKDTGKPRLNPRQFVSKVCSLRTTKFIIVLIDKK